jgi:hypothetical protein
MFAHGYDDGRVLDVPASSQKERCVIGKIRKGSIPPLPNARHPAANEVLRVWAVPGEAQQVTLLTTWKEPEAWGLLLADVARHATKAYGNEGKNEAQTLARILQFFEAEFASPTDEAKQI